MADLLTSGEPTAVRRRRRWTTPVAAVAVAAVAVVLAGRSGGAPDPEPPRVADESMVSVRPAPNPGRTIAAPVAVQRLDGDPGRAPAGLRLLVGGERPGVLDLGTGRLASLPGLTGGPGGSAEVRRVGSTTVMLVDHPADADSLRAYLLADGAPVVDLGPVRDALPLRDGSVLTVRCRGGATGCVLDSRSAAGERRWQRAVPRAARLLRETPLGVVLWVYDGSAGGGQVRIEDPRTGTPTRQLGRTYTVLATDDRRVAYQPPGCESDCASTVTTLGDGSRRSLDVTPGRAEAAAFSPDGRWLAVGFAGLEEWDPNPAVDRDGYVAVADLTTGRWQRVPGLTTAARSTPLPVWTGADRLLLVAGRDGANRFATWTVGAPRLTVLPTRLDGSYLFPGMAERLG